MSPPAVATAEILSARLMSESGASSAAYVYRKYVFLYQ